MFSIKKIHPFKLRKKLIKRSINWRTADAITIALMIFAAIALVALVYYQVRPMKLVDIKVPVSTEKPTYRAGENVNGIFFGEVFYDGEVRILRDVFCAGYQSRILTEEGDEIFNGVSRPTKLAGDVRTIGKLPDDVPVGKNCIIQFVNIYDIKTPFGNRHEEHTYYTQNFLIISDEADNEQSDLEDDVPRTEKLFDNEQTQVPADNQPSQNVPQQEPQEPARQEQPQEPTPAEPIAPPTTCAIDLLGIKLLCD